MNKSCTQLINYSSGLPTNPFPLPTLTRSLRAPNPALGGASLTASPGAPNRRPLDASPPAGACVRPDVEEVLLWPEEEEPLEAESFSLAIGNLPRGSGAPSGRSLLLPLDRGGAEGKSS